MKATISQLTFAVSIGATVLMSACKPDAPTADFTYTVDGMTVSFTATGDGEIDTYSWSLGDGSSASGSTATHTYEAGGNYSVTLTVENKGGSDSKTQEVSITSASSEAPQLQRSDADGACYAINTVATVTQAGFEITTKIATGVAWFGSEASFESAGNVSWSQASASGTLDIQPNNSYTYVETDFSTTGFADADIEWSVSGGGSTPAFTHNNTDGFPSLSKIVSDDNIDGSAEYTITHNGSISGADSVLFGVYGPDGSVIKMMAGWMSSATFTKAEMESVGKGSGILQIAAFTISDAEFSGKKIYFVNETVTTNMVTID